MSRRMMVLSCLAAAVMFCWSLPARSQQPPMSFGTGGGLIGFALVEPVQKELGIDKDDALLAKIRKLSGAMVRELDQAYQTASPEERAGLSATYQKIRSKYEPELQKLLIAEQFTRLKQISWQGRGPTALTDPDVVQALDITAEQIEKLAALNREYAEQQTKLVRERGLGAAADQEFNKKVQETIAERGKRVEQILSKSQQEKLAELKGPPFDFQRTRRPSAGPGGLIGLARMERVQKELGIETDEAKVEEIRKLAEQTMRDMRNQFINANNEPRERVDVRVQREADLKKLLTDEQFARLKQIHWQSIGPNALTDPLVVKAVDISQQQLEKLIAINRDFTEKMSQHYRQVRAELTEQESRKKVEEMAAERNKQIEQILSPAQLQKFVELKGQPFSFTNPAKSD